MNESSGAFFDPASFDRLTGGDAAFLDVESELTRMAVAACLVFEAAPSRLEDGRLDLDGIRARVARRLEEMPRYRQRLATSPLERRPIWVADEHFDLDRHIRHHVLSTGRLAELRSFCADQAASAFDRDHPLWQLWVIENLEDDRFAILIKAHHCMVDGIAGIELLRSMLDVEAGPLEDRIHHHRRRRTPSRIELAWLEAIERAKANARLVRDSFGALREPGELIREAGDLGRGLWYAQRYELHAASDTPLNHPASGDRSCAWLDLEISRIDEIRKAKGGTLNDVVVATLSLALDRLLEARGIPRRELLEMDLRVTCPVNTRSRGHRSEAANQIALLVVPLPTGESDPLVVLDRVRESLAEAKDSHMVEVLEAILRLADWLPRRFARGLVHYALKVRSANLVVTNIPGPRGPLHLGRSRLLAAYPIVPLMPGHALCVAVLSQAGTLHWGLNADRQAVRDLADWPGAIEEAFERLHAAATGSGD
ncbi:MAG: wax ester/triacylglycerol synthase family O-acyltransferase [Deltaproteobacteria bacterium]|jgi:WS/DGAT/MGAT family acyltransferase|nr:wax ester/triacylglycerol synthase family O-acyltransferase [Deltaproteobacteria bacterium]MBW2497927.1 wax ester/triacylglycerol synthase family O-acyltransferase [Deltaproteobacteria bacterium]